MANRFERGKLPPYTIPDSFDRLGTRIIGLNEIVGGEAPPAYQVPAGTLVWDYTLTQKTSADGLLPINGQAISRTTYAALYSALGVTYGVGDGVNTFNIPSAIELYSRVLGPTTAVRGAYSRAILPEHQHNITTPAQNSATRYAASPTPTGEFLNPGGQNILRVNTGTDVNSFAANINPGNGLRMTAYITTDVYSLKVGQIIYGLSDELLNYAGGKFLKCNGASFSPGTYSQLATVLSSTAAPDLRGYYPVIRAFTAASRAEGTGGSMVTHSHSSPVAFTGLLKASIFSPPSASRQYLAGPTPGSGQTLNLESFVNSSTYTLGPGTDNRPANVALDFLICAV